GFRTARQSVGGGGESGADAGRGSGSRVLYPLGYPCRWPSRKLSQDWRVGRRRARPVYGGGQAVRPLVGRCRERGAHANEPASDHARHAPPERRPVLQAQLTGLHINRATGNGSSTTPGTTTCCRKRWRLGRRRTRGFHEGSQDLRPLVGQCSETDGHAHQRTGSSARQAVPQQGPDRETPVEV
ncbi:unnamed protein product, partial [Ectocarpus sp. 12 AP-2014]